MPGKGSVLIVDDHTDTRELLAEYLSYLGFDVATAATGEDAVTMVEQLRPQVVLMDLWLPGRLDGFDATRRIKANRVTRNTAVIAVTGDAVPADHERAMHAGCQAVFIKPVDFKRLVADIELLVARAHSATLPIAETRLLKPHAVKD